jgi:hypothetical protein
VLICVVTCPKNKARVQAQLETWVPQATVEVKFFDGQSLGVPDDYYLLPHKVRKICEYAMAAGHNRIIKIDDDTWLNNRQFKVIEADYAGIRKPGDYASGGAYWLSRRAMEIVARYGLHNHWAEDVAVGQLLAQHGIQLTDIPYILPGAGVAAEYNCPCGLGKCKDKSGPIWEYFPEAAVITQLGPDQMRACHKFYQQV